MHSIDGRQIILLILILILPTSHTQNPRPAKKSLDRVARREFWLSSSQPFTDYLSAYPDVISATDTIITHIQTLERDIQRAVSSPVSSPTHSFRPCKVYFPERTITSFRRAIVRKLISRGLPEPDTNCITQVTHMSGGASRLADTVYEAMQVRGDVMHKHRHALAQTAIDNFTHPVVLYNFKHKTLTQACTLHYIGALRVGAKWYTNVGLTSLPTHFHAKFNSRQYITEFIRSEDGKLGDALRMKVAVRPVRNEAREKRNDTTTILITGRRDVNPSFLGELPPYENPAIIASYARGEFYILQAADALTPSSIAILFLPLLLNLVPVSLIAHVKRSAMLGYILISDVLTCIPLLIKGAELISISTLRHRSVVTRLSASVNSSVSRSAVAESFGAECAAKEGFRSVGVVFVVIAMIVMVGGIAAEFFARRYAVDVRRRTFCKTGLEMGIGANHVGLFGVEYDK